MSDDNAQIKRHESLYFAEGNVIISALRQDKSGLLFRVHKSILSRHSPIFSDMFAVCNTSGTDKSEADHSHDGLPLVHLSDDADHLASVLDVLYYQSDLPWMPRNPDYPALITPFLNLSRKYEIDRMYARIIKHLEYDWPQTLRDWDRLEKDIEFAMRESEVECIDDHFPEPAAAIKLAHQFDLNSILPAAFYHLSRLSIQNDRNKICRDSSTRTGNTTQRTARWELLSATDFRCLLLGKAELADFLRGCVQPKNFRHAIAAVRGGMQDCQVGEGLWKDLLDRCIQSGDPLTALQTPVGGNNPSGCYICTNPLRAKARIAREQIWEKLSDLFHLEDNEGKSNEIRGCVARCLYFVPTDH